MVKPVALIMLFYIPFILQAMDDLEFTPNKNIIAAAVFKEIVGKLKHVYSSAQLQHLQQTYAIPLNDYGPLSDPETWLSKKITRDQLYLLNERLKIPYGDAQKMISRTDLDRITKLREK